MFSAVTTTLSILDMGDVAKSARDVAEKIFHEDVARQQLGGATGWHYIDFMGSSMGSDTTIVW